MYRLPGLTEKISHMLAEIRSLHAENESLKSKAAKDAMGDITDRMQQVGDLLLPGGCGADVDMNGRGIWAMISRQNGRKAVVVLASARTARSA